MRHFDETTVQVPIPAKADPERCAQLVWSYGPGWTRQEHCLRRGRVEEQGKLWCHQHAPSKAKERRERQSVRLKMRWERTYKPRSHAVEMLQVIRDVAAGIVRDPQALCIAFLKRYEAPTKEE